MHHMRLSRIVYEVNNATRRHAETATKQPTQVAEHPKETIQAVPTVKSFGEGS
jgi:hypothetical protein